MVNSSMTVLIMAAGTGGHIFPALSVARELQLLGARVEWLGTPSGFEHELLTKTGIPLHTVPVKGLRGTGTLRLLFAPFMLARAFWESLKVLRRVRPNSVLGMGGFVTGPAGLAAKAMGMPLLIHEQNAVAGLTNRLLFPISVRAMETFPSTFPAAKKVSHTGNPVRREILELCNLTSLSDFSNRSLKLLVLGGSLGAEVLNKILPELLVSFSSKSIQTLHQTGRRQFSQTLQRYKKLGHDTENAHRVVAFIEQISEAYRWADIVLCRSGASTVCELAVAAKPAILVPYPFHKDRQQLRNARWLHAVDAAEVIEQNELDLNRLIRTLDRFVCDKGRLKEMGFNASKVAIRDAHSRIANLCLEVARG
ncbi:MAG: undecaprenyldiphospho-muramoylpentapeptide beta-N-acetylglucosaminyltransferase [Gammaproteobacteria bacterium]|nr:undecaprenyldiphospho-muramoylpentapeptide beta-N-acetylglucosaminyltransferase [Gammaproteobacteria bacterium]